MDDAASRKAAEELKTIVERSWHGEQNVIDMAKWQADGAFCELVDRRKTARGT